MKDKNFKYSLAEWYVKSIRNVTNKEKVINSFICNVRVFDYLSKSNYSFLNKLYTYITNYNKGNREEIRKNLINQLTFCMRNKFIYNYVIEVIYNHIRKAKAIHSNWKEVYHIIKDKEIDMLLTYLDDNNYKLCVTYLYGVDCNMTNSELYEERINIKLEIVNRLGELIDKNPLTLDDFLNGKNKTNTDRVYINNVKCKKLKKIGITNINLFVNEYIDKIIDENGGKY